MFFIIEHQLYEHSRGESKRCENEPVKIIPPGLVVAHSAIECQTKSARQRVGCLTHLSGDHMPFKKCASKDWVIRAAQP